MWEAAGSSISLGCDLRSSQTESSGSRNRETRLPNARYAHGGVYRDEAIDLMIITACWPGASETARPWGQSHCPGQLRPNAPVRRGTAQMLLLRGQ
jgi:hypothetical protein